MEGKSIYDYCFNTFQEKMIDRTMSMRRIKVTKEEVSRVVSQIVDYVKLFSSLSEFDDNLDDKTLDKWPVLDEFAGLVQPASVKLIAGDMRCRDLVWHEIPNFSPSFDVYMNAITEFRTWRKRNATEFIQNLNQLKVNVSLNDVAFKVVDSHCRVSVIDQLYCPIILTNPEVVEFCTKGFVYRADVAPLLSEYIINAMK